MLMRFCFVAVVVVVYVVFDVIVAVVTNAARFRGTCRLYSNKFGQLWFLVEICENNAIFNLAW